MGSDAPVAQKDDLDLEDSLINMNIEENLSREIGLFHLDQKQHQSSLVSSSGKWLQIVKNSPKGSFSCGTRFLDNRIPRHLVSLDEKYLRRCLDLIHSTALKSSRCSLSMNFVGSVPKMGISSYQFDSSVIPKENTYDLARLVFDLPLVDDSGNSVISPTITGYKRVVRPLLHNLEALDGDYGEKGLVSCDVPTSPSQFLGKIKGNYVPNSRFSSSPSLQAVSSSSANSTCSSSEQSYWSSPSSRVSQGTLQFTMKDNKTPHFVFSLDDQKEVYMASLNSGIESGFDRSALDYSYLIHLQKGRGVEPCLVGRLNVQTLFNVSSANAKIVERQFVLFSSGGNFQAPPPEIRRNRGLPKKVVNAIKSTRTYRQRSISRFSRTSSIPDLCSWEPFQEQDHDLEPVNILENELPSNLETSAVIVREEFPEEETAVGGWGMKFLKKTSLSRTKDASENSTSIDVVIPAGIHGGPRTRNGGPSSLIQRWKSGGNCDCSGWDLGCSLTVLKGQQRKDQNESQCNLFELFTEGLKNGTPGLRIMSVRDGLYFVQFQTNISVLQAFSIALAYIHSQSERLRPWPSGKCTELD